MILPGVDGPAAAAIAERLRGAIQAREFEHRYAPPSRQVTISVGVAARRCGESMGAKPLVAEADRALYAAKHAGRNRVRLATPAPPSAPTQAALGSSKAGLSKRPARAAGLAYSRA